jgi:hypothetical protein
MGDPDAPLFRCLKVDLKIKNKFDSILRVKEI